MNAFFKADWAPALKHAARVVGIVVALVVTVAWIAGECAFDLGRQLRLAIEARNDQLAYWWVGVLGLRPEPELTPAPAPAAAPIPVPVIALQEPAAEPVPASNPLPAKRKATQPAATTKAPAKPRQRKASARRVVATT